MPAETWNATEQRLGTAPTQPISPRAVRHGGAELYVRRGELPKGTRSGL